MAHTTSDEEVFALFAAPAPTKNLLATKSSNLRIGKVSAI